MDYLPRLIWILGLLTVCSLCANGFECPKACRCSRYGKGKLSVTCEHKKLDAIPDGIPIEAIELYLGFNSIIQIKANAFSNLTHLQQLSLKSNSIALLEHGAFNGLSQLTALFLTNNKIQIIGKDVFAPLINLQNMYLTQNLLQGIPDVAGCVSLKRFNINNNKLKNASFPDSYSTLENLTSINLNVNHDIKHISRKDFSPLSKVPLVKLSIERCGLMDIENGTFGMLPHLLSLQLAYNKIPAQDLKHVITGLQGSLINSLDLSGVITNGTLPADTFDSLKGVPLLHLNLKHSQIPEIQPQTFQYLNVLQTLDLSYSQISKADVGAFDGLRKLQRLLLHDNTFKKLPMKLPNNCRYLDLSYNALAEPDLDVGVVDDLFHLEELYLHHCQLYKIANLAFQSTVNLKILDLSDNYIPNTNLGSSVFQSLGKLEHLDMSHNRLMDFNKEHSIFKYLIKVKTINMSGNNCEKLPTDCFAGLSKLENLDLSYNNLGQEIAGSASIILFDSLKNLLSLNISHNNIDVIPPALFTNLYALKWLRLDYNRISQWQGNVFSDTVSLTKLNMSSNQISIVNQSSFDSLQRYVESIDLSKNPFSCYCNLEWFRNWVNDTNITFDQLQTYTCNSPKNMVGKSVLSFDPRTIKYQCHPPPWMIIVITASLSVFVLMCLISITLYRKRWKIRLWFYQHGQRANSAAIGDNEAILDNNEEFKYDCFVSVVPDREDEDWVKDVLLPKIDNGTAMDIPFDYGEDAHGQYKIFCASIHQMPGAGLGITQIADAIDQSRKVMILLSRQYIRSGQQMEFELPIALQKIGKHGLSCIILVILEPGTDVRLPQGQGKLHELLNRGLDLKWTADADGQEVFWSKLNDYLGDIE